VPEIRVCSVTDVPAGDKRCFDVDGHKVCVAHLGADWYAVDDTCSHEDYSLCEGDLWEDELEIECPKHGSTFSLLTGEPATLPATQPVPVFAADVVDGDVFVTVTGEAAS
jgi:3-phenylpropionate/trans-cinnamate dioxygenase ferredoxin subunit